MTSIFINYRRDDTSGYSGRLQEHLSSIFGSEAVFMDLDDIHPGVNFVHAIDEGLIRCDVMIVLIGKRWLDAKDSQGRRRLDSPDDFVRIEIARALERKIRVIPVLVSNATMPSEKELPAALAQLSSIQATELTDERWEYDLGQLINTIGGVGPRKSGRRNLWIGITVALVALISIAFFLMGRRASPSPDFTGRWVADTAYDFGARYSERFAFRMDAGALSGVASFLGVERGIVEGKITNDQISFITHTDEVVGDEKRQTQHHYRGTLAGDEIRFVMQTEGGFSDHPPIEFVARRKPETDTGKSPTP